MKTVLNLLHQEIVSVYGSLHLILAALVVLGVVHLTTNQIAAWIVIASAVLVPIVRAQVTPTGPNPPAQPAPALNTGTYIVSGPAVVPFTPTTTGATETDPGATASDA